MSRINAQIKIHSSKIIYLFISEGCLLKNIKNPYPVDTNNWSSWKFIGQKSACNPGFRLF